jgi:type IV pilus assembly protein PilC
MVETGITLSAALAGIIEQEKNPTLCALLSDLKRSVEAGDDFSAALERYPKYFDRTFVALIRASEATGTLAEMLERTALYMRMELDNRGKVRAAMAYPVVMLVMACGVTFGLLVFVLPQFMPLFSRKGMELPKSTEFMMAASRLLIDHWPWWIAGAAAVIGGFLYGRRTPKGRETLDSIKIRLPIVGTVVRKVVISRCVRTLGTMVASGVSMLEALKLTADVAGNHEFEKMWRDVRERVTSGAQINESLSHHAIFPPMITQMIASGEQSGKLDIVLERVSAFYDREVENSIKTATSLIEPVMICLMGVVVGGIGMSLLLPIFSLSRGG